MNIGMMDDNHIPLVWVVRQLLDMIEGQRLYVGSHLLEVNGKPRCNCKPGLHTYAFRVIRHICGGEGIKVG